MLEQPSVTSLDTLSDNTRESVKLPAAFSLTRVCFSQAVPGNAAAPSCSGKLICCSLATLEQLTKSSLMAGPLT